MNTKPKSLAKRTRRSRHKRVAQADRPPMALTERDKDIIRAVNDHRALKQQHIQALFFHSRSTAQFRLQRLFQHEFLERQFLSVVSGGPASSPAVYTLGKRGARLLVDELGYTPSELRLPKATFSWQFVEHTLRIADFRVAVARACALHGFTLEEWHDEATFRAQPDYVMLRDKRGKAHKKPVLPDGYFRLTSPRGTSRFFLEVDRGTEDVSRFTPQILVYNQYTKNGQYQERYRSKSLRVLVVTSSPRRRETLEAATRRVGGDRKYWFTTFDAVTAESVFMQPIWYTLESDVPQPLITLEWRTRQQM